MSNVVGEVQVRVRPDGRDFGPELQSILNRATGQTRQAAQQINQAFGQANQGAAQLGQSIDNNIGRKFADAAIQAAGFTASIYATKAAIEGTVGKLAGLFDQLAQAKAGFNAIIGQRAGEDLLAEIREFARVSPFVTQELVNYSQQLLGVGLAAEKIVPLLRDTGNVIASVGGDTANLSRVLFTMTQIQTVGRLTGQDAMQLQSALIPITKMLSEYLGKTTVEVKKLQEQGAISAETVFAAIQAAGQKVPGAMDSAVRNIAGARAVLSDTIQILMQDAPALNRIYEDIVQGIQSFAAKLGDPEVQGVITDALESVGHAYDAIKPVMEEFLAAMGSASLVGLKTFGTVLETLGSVLNSIPEPVLESLAKLLAVMVTLQAPRYFIQYVSNLKTMAGIFTSGGAGLIGGMTRMNTVTNQQTVAAKNLTSQNYLMAASLRAVGAAMVPTAAQAEILTKQWQAQQKAGRLSGFMQRNSGAFQTGGAIGAGLAGQYLQGQSPTNANAQGAGGALTYGAMGFMLGGPAGAAIGASLGGITGYLNAQEEKAEEHAKKMKELGERSARDFINANSDEFGSATGESAALLERRLAELRAQKAALMGEGSQVTGSFVLDGFFGGDEGDGIAKLRAIADQTKTIDADMAALNVTQDELFGGIQNNIERVLLQLDDPKIREGFLNKFFGSATFNNQTGGYEWHLKSIDELEKGAAAYGITLDKIGVIGEDALEKIATQFEGLIPATQQAIIAANDFNVAFEKSKGLAEARFGGLGKEISNRISVFSAERAAIEANSKAYQNQGDTLAQMQAEQATYHAAELAYQLAYTEYYNNNKGRLGEVLAAEQALAAGVVAGQAAIDAARVTGMSTLDALAKKYNYTKEQLATILNLEQALDPTVNIVVTADVTQALDRLARLAVLQQNIMNPKPGNSYASADTLAAQYASYEDQKQKILASLGAAPPAYTTPIKPDKPGPAGPKGPDLAAQFANKVEQAGDSLRNSIIQAMEAVKQGAEAWKNSVKEATQYEPGVSAGRALRNTNRQITDITAITAGIKALKARGLSEAALDALDINAITDARQVKKLLNSSPAQLAALSAAVSRRDLLASTLSSSRAAEENRKNITAAIVEAAKLLGYTPTQAQALVQNLTITANTNPDLLVSQFLAQLSGGKISV